MAFSFKMSAYNRKVLKKMGSNSACGSFDADSTMEESGYASFKVLHNSTVEAPFFIERDCETENCRNAFNTNATSNNALFGRLHKTSFNSTQFQSPGGSSTNASHDMLQPGQDNQSHCQLQLESDDDMTCKSPVLFSNQLAGLMGKRRKSSHYQAITHHSSPKKSKKKLFPAPTHDPISRRTRYYNGLEKLDIIDMLINTLPALECILAYVDPNTLDVMTKVSERWALAVHKIKKAEERLLDHRFKMNLTKENSHSMKLGHMLSKSINNHIVPLQQSNAIHRPNTRLDNCHKSVSMDESCMLVEQMQRIKCPRCGKGSKVFFSKQPGGDQTPQTPRFPQFSAPTALSQTLPPHSYSFSEPKSSTLTRFYSLDEMKSSPCEAENELRRPYTFGECTSIPCRFIFCVRCYCPPHPGEKCLVTEMGTPSKVMMPGERVTPPKRTQKFDSKLSRKRSLKRLNF